MSTIIHVIFDKIYNFTECVYFTEAVRNISDPHTVVPTRDCVRPVQVPSGITCVRRHWAVNVALRLCVRTVVNGRRFQTFCMVQIKLLIK